jgi:tetratricopeptide (TPR) repeat protein
VAAPRQIDAAAQRVLGFGASASIFPVERSMAGRKTIAFRRHRRASRLAVSAAALAATLGLALPAMAAATRCDTLAGHPLDPHKVALGVNFTAMDARAAIAACNAALKADPQNPRLKFELGRAQERSGAYADAVAAYRAAADQGYAAAQNALGAMYQDGLGVKKDRGAAEAWFRRAADQGYQPAVANLVALAPPQPAPASEAPPAPPPPAAPEPAAAPATPAPGPSAPAVAPLPPAAPAPPAEAAPSSPAPAPAPTSQRPVPVTTPPAPPSAPAPPREAAAPLPSAPPPPAPPQQEAVAPPAPLTPSAPAPSPNATALGADPQFKSDLGQALTQCILPEAQKGNAAFDEAQAANLLIGKCQGPWIAWVNKCVDQGDSKESCIRKSRSFARAAVQQQNPTN